MEMKTIPNDVELRAYVFHEKSWLMVLTFIGMRHVSQKEDQM